MTSSLLVLLENTNCTDCVGVMKCKAKATTFKSVNSSLVYWCLMIHVHIYTCIYLLKFPVAGWLCVIAALSVLDCVARNWCHSYYKLCMLDVRLALNHSHK